MKNTFPGHFRPTIEDFDSHWKNSTFVVDANVLLNLYRYSPATRTELQNVIKQNKKKIFIPHQAAKEFLKNRLSVTSSQAKEYTGVIKQLEEFVTKITSKDRHPFVSDEKIKPLEEFSTEIISNLKEQQKSLLDKLSNDEILDFIQSIFENKTGKPYPIEKLNEIVKEGEQRYKNEIPPGYKDANKDESNDPYRKYGDLIVWQQTIDFATENQKSVIFITDDKKEDWWLEQSGKTVGPRPELIEEFLEKTGQKFWMYSVGKFVQESAARNKKQVSEDVINEIRMISEELERIYNEGIGVKALETRTNTPSIMVTQEVHSKSEYGNTGIITVSLTKNMRYATGSGKFTPRLNDIPRLQINVIETPEIPIENIHISYGCGTTKDFNVHLKAKSGELLAGDYVFHYQAICFEDDPIENVV